jgi:hypothetical protein
MIARDDGRFKIIVRPVITVNTNKKRISWIFETEMRSSLLNERFSSPIWGVLVLPIIMDRTIVPPPKDYVGYQRRDNSVSVSVNIDFDLWQRSAEVEALGLLSENIRCSLNRIEPRYLLDEDRGKLLITVNSVQARLASRLLN